MDATTTPAARLATATAAARFLTGGRARLTLRSVSTGTRFTYRVRAAGEDRPGLYFVDVLTGSNNESDYTFLGTYTARGGFRHSAKSRIGADAPSALAFGWSARKIGAGEIPATLEVWHEGCCARCGRTLTDPDSIESGFGPVCVKAA